MTLMREVVKNAAVGVAIADKPDDLAAIKTPGCAAAIWRRPVEPGFQTWLDALRPDRLPHGRIAMRHKAVRGAVERLCDLANTPKSAERTYLINDIAALANLFEGLMPSGHVRLRLEPVRSNACRKFHIDALTARLICTYRGTGTQYGISTDGLDPARVFTVPTGSPVVLRGTLWPETPRSGLLHRSPPIEGTDETRLVLVLDPVFDPEDMT
ncbi:DUF1826 domain-containing protein [Roseobacter sp.]|uniref:DUF1826 domain-containing protein n=1 Tax=Roseobacter sp. TaxID=1907202 RepID=UPI0032985A89